MRVKCRTNTITLKLKNTDAFQELINECDKNVMLDEIYTAEAEDDKKLLEAINSKDVTVNIGAASNA